MPSIQSSTVMGKNEDGSDIPKMLTSLSGGGTSDKLDFHVSL